MSIGATERRETVRRALSGSGRSKKAAAGTQTGSMIVSKKKSSIR
jgi:hypothetical protein